MAEEEAPKAWSFADQNKDEQAVALAALVLDQCGEGDDKFAPEKFEAVLKAAGLSVAPHWVSVFSKAATLAGDLDLSLIHISEPRDQRGARMPSSA